MLLMCFMSTSEMWANYYVTAKIQTNSKGKGYVYASTSNVSLDKITGWQENTSEQRAGSSSVTMYWYAKADKGCTFKGWSNSDTGGVSTTANPYSMVSDKSVTYYAVFEVTNSVSLSEENSLVELLAGQNGYHANLTLARNFEAGKWYTLVLPFSLNETQIKAAFGEDVQISNVTANDKTGVTFTPQEQLAITANMPVLICPSVKVDNGLSFDDVKLVNAEPKVTLCEGVEFVGNYDGKIDIPADGDATYYYIAGNQLKKSTGTQTMKGFRAYFRVNNNAVAAKAFFDNFSFAETTGIEAVEQEENLKTDNAIYDLQGRKVEAPTRGLYIINGKKVVLK